MGKQPDSNAEADAPLSGSTLEDYFASHKTSGQVSQHLLNASDVMAVEKLAEDKSGVDGTLATEGGATAEPKEAASGLVGMTLSDYLHVNEDEAQAKLSRASSARLLPPQLAAKKASPTSDVSGMSLDHYLGASEGGEDHAFAARAEKKPSPKLKRKSTKAKHTGPALPQSFAVKGNGLTHVHHVNSSVQNLSSDEESSSSSPSSSLTPFQRRQKRKDRAKAKLQQRHGDSGSSISKAILMADAVSPSMGLSFRDREREKRKASMAMTTTNASVHPHHHSAHPSTPSVQIPLPKLSPSPSVRSLSHKDHDVNGSPSNDDSINDTNEKLPPL